MNIKDLKDFLVKAKKSTYASWEESIKIKERDNSTTLVFENWDFKYHDNYFGWEPYWWREVVFYKWNIVYIMIYYWFVYSEVSNVGEIYKTLQKALSKIPKDYPYRWPENLKEWEFEYINNFSWEIDNFSWEEIIKVWQKILYKAKYMWWFVDVK